MLIGCETNNKYKRFYIPDISTMQELKIYAENNMPIQCYMLDGRYRNSIFLEKDMIFVHLYLNNYLQYYEINGYIINRKKLNEIEDALCFNCINKDCWYDDCEYIKDDSGGCKNYKKKPDNIFVRFLNKLR